jgi:sialidase-1
MPFALPLPLFALLLPLFALSHDTDGTWLGTELCTDGVCDVPASAAATLTLKDGVGTYRVGSATSRITARQQEGAGFLRGNLTTMDGKPHGEVMLYASADEAYGSFFSLGSKRLFHWSFRRATPPTPLGSVTVFEEGTLGYACHRVPGLVRLPGSGALLLFVESRRDSCSDQAAKDVNLRRSLDNGATWSDAIIRVIGGAAESRALNTTYRNPYPSVVVGSGGGGGGDVVLLNVANSTVAEPWASLQLKSSDGGLSWSAPASVGAGWGALQGILGGPGNGIELGQKSTHSPSAGRMLSCGATGYHHGHAMEAGTFSSDDQGRSWQAGAHPLPSMQECQLAELSNGSVVMNMRQSVRTCASGGHCRAVSVSDDGGASWPAPWFVEALPDPVVSAGLLNAGGGGAPDSLFFSNPSSGTHRVNMTVQRSDDAGQSWAAARTVWAGPAAYSVLVELNETHVGLVFENGNAEAYERVSFVALPKTLQ